jgi:hypothetical protein
MLVDGNELELAWTSRQLVREDDGRPLDHFPDDALVATMRDDRQPARDRGTQSGRMVEMMMADDDGRDRLARHECVGRIDPRQGGRGASAGLEHDEMVANSITGPPFVPTRTSHTPRASSVTWRRALRRRRHAAAAAASAACCLGKRRQLVRGHVDTVGIDLEHQRHLIAPVEPVHEPVRQLHACVRHVARVVRGNGHVPEVAVRHDAARPGGQLRAGVDSDPERRAVLDRELHDRQAVLHRDSTESGFGIERGEQGRQWMIEHVRACLRGGRPVPAVAERRRKREHVAAALLVQRSPVSQVERSLRIDHRTPFRRRVHMARRVAAAILIHPLAEAGEDEVIDGAKTIDAAHRVGH